MRRNRAKWNCNASIAKWLHKKVKKEPENATYASVKKEMAEPRMAKSARIVKMDLARSNEHGRPRVDQNT